MKNPVARVNNEYNKPKTFRNRKTVAKDTGDYKEHHRLAPYERGSARNLLLEWDTDADFASYGDEDMEQEYD
jgi:hypothetical protein